MTAIQLIEKLLTNSPMAVAEVYRRHGIMENPSVATTLQAIETFGEPFLMELFEIHHAEAQFLGIHLGKKKNKNTSSPEGQQEEKKEKKNLWQKFKGIFKKGKDAVTGAQDDIEDISEAGKTAIGSAKDIMDTAKDLKKSGGSKSSQRTSGEDDKKKDEEKFVGSAMFYVLIFVVVAIILVMAYFASQKK